MKALLIESYSNQLECVNQSMNMLLNIVLSDAHFREQDYSYIQGPVNNPNLLKFLERSKKRLDDEKLKENQLKMLKYVSDDLLQKQKEVNRIFSLDIVEYWEGYETSAFVNFAQFKLLQKSQKQIEEYQKMQTYLKSGLGFYDQYSSNMAQKNQDNQISTFDDQAYDDEYEDGGQGQEEELNLVSNFCQKSLEQKFKEISQNNQNFAEILINGSKNLSNLSYQFDTDQEQEKNKLVKHLQEIRQENEDLRSKLQQQSSYIKQLGTQHDQEQLALRDKISFLEKQKRTLEEQLGQYETKEDYQEKYKRLYSQYEETKAGLKKSGKEVLIRGKKIKELEALVQELKENTGNENNKAGNQDEESLNLKEIQQDFELQKQSMAEINKELIKKNGNLKLMFDTVKLQKDQECKKLNDEVYNLQVKIGKMETQQKLDKVNKGDFYNQIQEINEDHRMKVQEYKTSIYQLELDNKELEKKINQLSKDVARSEKEVVSLEKENLELERYKKDHDYLYNQYQEMKKKENKAKDLEFEFQNCQRELEVTQDKLKMQSKEFELQSAKIDELNEQLVAAEKKKQDNQIMTDEQLAKIMVYESNIEDNKNYISNLEQEYKEIKYKFQRQTKENEFLRKEVEILKYEKQSITNQIKTKYEELYNKKNEQTQDIVDSKDSEIKKLNQQFLNKDAQCQQQINELENQLYQYKKQNELLINSDKRTSEYGSNKSNEILSQQNYNKNQDNQNYNQQIQIKQPIQTSNTTTSAQRQREQYSNNNGFQNPSSYSINTITQNTNKQNGLLTSNDFRKPNGEIDWIEYNKYKLKYNIK